MEGMISCGLEAHVCTGEGGAGWRGRHVLVNAVMRNHEWKECLWFSLCFCSIGSLLATFTPLNVP